MTEQEIFETVLKHLKKQGKRGSVEGSKWGPNDCRYRTPDGLKCAVGCLIKDEDYHEDMEGNNVEQMIELEYLPNYLVPFKSLLNALQMFHDFHFGERLATEALEKLAAHHNLTIPDFWAKELTDVKIP